MPELPEVENIALGLRQAAEGRHCEGVSVSRVSILKGPGRVHWRQCLADWEGRTLVRITRRAKRLIVANDQGAALVIQLGMTGKFLLRNRSSETLKHTHLKMRLDQGVEIHFIDTRRFGRVWLFPEWDPQAPDRAMEAADMGPLGPEAPTISVKRFQSLLSTSRPIKSLLLDQTRIAGLGNIYVDESLFAAGLLPSRPAISLTEEEAKVLCHQMKAVLRRAIRAGGTTFSDYRNAYGDMGRFRKRLKVYGCEGQPCRICTTPIEKTVLAGRGTHVCPQCQR